MNFGKRRGAEAPLALNNVRILRLRFCRLLLGDRLHRVGTERDARQSILQVDGGEVVNLPAVDLIHGHHRGHGHHLGVHAHPEDTHAGQLHAVAVQQEVDKRLTDGIHGCRQLPRVDTGVLRRILQHILAVDL